jgi:hypothetical protein
VSVSFYPLNNAAASGVVVRSGTNWGYESGLTNWTPYTPSTTDSWVVIGAAPGLAAHEGSYYARFHTFVNHITTGALTIGDKFATVAGKSWTTKCWVIAQAPNYSAFGRASLQWLDAGNNVVSTSYGNSVNGNGGIASPPWHESTCTAVCPVGATQVRFAADASNDNTSYVGAIFFDIWTLQSND